MKVTKRDEKRFLIDNKGSHFEFKLNIKSEILSLTSEDVSKSIEYFQSSYSHLLIKDFTYQYYIFKDIYSFNNYLKIKLSTGQFHLNFNKDNVLIELKYENETK